MAKAKKPTTKKVTSSKDDSTVIRISASDGKNSTKKTTPTAKPTKTAKASAKKKTEAAVAEPSVRKRKKKGLLGGIIGYFKGAWQELKLVRWPTRKATWGLTFAVLAFSAFFVVFILLLDAGFKYLFEIMYRQ